MKIKLKNNMLEIEIEAGSRNIINSLLDLFEESLLKSLGFKVEEKCPVEE